MFISSRRHYQGLYLHSTPSGWVWCGTRWITGRITAFVDELPHGYRYLFRTTDGTYIVQVVP